MSLKLMRDFERQFSCYEWKVIEYYPYSLSPVVSGLWRMPMSEESLKRISLLWTIALKEELPNSTLIYGWSNKTAITLCNKFGMRLSIGYYDGVISLGNVHLLNPGPIMVYVGRSVGIHLTEVLRATISAYLSKKDEKE